MRLKTLELNGFKSFSHKTIFSFDNSVVCIVGPNGSGKSNVVEAIRFVLGEQSIKSMRGKMGTDLIFKGSKKLSKSSRAKVSIYLDNTDKIFKLLNNEGQNIDFNYDTISISREVYSDGVNKYLLNGTEVRLKDINHLLSSVNVGSSGHHIISQGEADRILNANGKEKREMIEDALGLKIYQYKIKESERKLERTQNNMKEITLLRRENAPHLNFLKKQVEKFEKTKETQNKLVSFYQEYLKKESVYLEKEKNTLEKEKNKISTQLVDISLKISENENDDNIRGNKKINELKIVEQKINEIRNIKGEVNRKLGRIEGMIEGEEHHLEKDTEYIMSPEEVKVFIKDINSSIDEAILKNNIDEVQPILKRIKEILNNFDKINKTEKNESSFEINNLKNTQNEILQEIQELDKKEEIIKTEIEHLKDEINKEMEELRDKEREKFSFKVKHQELSSSLNLINLKEQNLTREIEAFENEIKEGSVLIGSDILSYKDFEFKGEVDRNIQEKQRRKIERLKIKIEDAGSTNGAEMKKEFDEVLERDNFLAKEIEDLEKSIILIEKLIVDLKEKIDFEFKEGIRKINLEFQKFFSLMFGGGTGSLSIIEIKKTRRPSGLESNELDEYKEETEDDEKIVFEQGIEINVSLPHKKVKELHALSGGERSLTSIALLFAMSQVNPPPFLVLDETDAALDEANSRKYGDMLEKLSKHSQLVIVTHNRETMSRAEVLYGVTIGSDGDSKLLSVKFDEAVAIAK